MSRPAPAPQHVEDFYAIIPNVLRAQGFQLRSHEAEMFGNVKMRITNDEEQATITPKSRKLISTEISLTHTTTRHLWSYCTTLRNEPKRY